MNKYVFLLILAVLVSSISQIILKKSSSKTYKSIIKEYLNVYVITGYGLMVLSTVLVVLGLKGVPYKNEPIIESLGYLFVMILSNRLLGEKITKKKVLGNVLILVGIAVYYIWWFWQFGVGVFFDRVSRKTPTPNCHQIYSLMIGLYFSSHILTWQR